MIGRTISHYKILEKLGAGAMGVVYKAEDTRLKRTVALKFLSRQALGDENAKARFFREAQAAASLDHPNICTIYEIADAEGETFISMAYVAGRSLREHVAAPLKLPEALDIAIGTGKGLQEAHEQKIIHRDIKSANILINKKGEPKITDFGLAHLAERSTLTKTGTTLGTPAYMSPEQALGKPADRRSDVWSLGVVLYEMITGRLPFEGDHEQVIIYDIINEPHEPVTGRRAGLPLELDRILGKALAKNPDERYQHADDLVVDLRRLRKQLAPEKSKRPAAKPLESDVGAQRAAPEVTTGTPAGPESTPLPTDVPAQPATPEAPTPASTGVGARHAVPSEPESTTLTQTKPAATPRSPAPAQPDVPRERIRSGIPALAASILITAALTWWLASTFQTPPTQTELKLTQLTFDSGLTYQPAISADGKFVAYASDRAGDGNLDIWVQQIGGGEPVRLTTHEADDYEPDFSPDGSRLAFRSERDGGGVYFVPTLGGQPRLIAPGGRLPRFSPAGDRIAFVQGGRRTDDRQIYVASVAGGDPALLTAEFVGGIGGVSHPIWSPDGSHILFYGQHDEASGFDRDWWVIPAAGGEPIRTEVFRELAPLGFAVAGGGLAGRRARPTDWIPNGEVLFSAEDKPAVWSISVDPDSAKAQEGPRRWTFGPGRQVEPRSGGDRYVFTSLNSNTDIWSLPLSPNEGKATGLPVRVTHTPANESRPSGSLDGRVMVFNSDRSGNQDILVRDLMSGSQSSLTETPENESWAVISQEGDEALYSVAGSGGHVYLRDLSGGLPKRVCDSCTSLMTDWSKLKQKALYFSGSERTVWSLDLFSGATTRILTHADHPVYAPKLSLDAQWVAFFLGRGATGQIFVSPYDGETLVPVADWIGITDGSEDDGHPQWSLDGNLLYFVSARDSFSCLWAQRLDPKTKSPDGEPFAVHHFHSARLNLDNVGNRGYLGLSITRDRIFFTTAELTGNIWLMEPVE